MGGNPFFNAEFGQGVLQGIQQRKQERQTEEELGLRKERLKLLSAQQKGAEAALQLKQEEQQLKLQELRQGLLERLQIGQITGGGAPQAPQAVPPQAPQAVPPQGFGPAVPPPPGQGQGQGLGPAVPPPPGQPGDVAIPSVAVMGEVPQSTELETEMARIDTQLRQLSALPPSKLLDTVVDNTRQRLSQLQKLKADALSEERRPTELRFKTRAAIRTEPAFKDLSAARQAFNIIMAGATEKSNFGDLAMINGFARMLVPGSVVRPSEFETVRAVRPFLERLRGLRARIERGEQLTEGPNGDRARLVSATKRVMQKYIDEVRRELTPVYEPILEDAGIDFNEVFVDPKDVLRGAPDAPEASRVQSLTDAQLDQRIKALQ